jgi:hypothetical protein
MRIRRSSIRLSLIAVALLSGCGAAQTSVDTGSTGRSHRPAELLDCPGDALPDALIDGLVARGYVNDVALNEGEASPPGDVVAALNRLASRVRWVDAGFYFARTPTTFGTALIWVDSPDTDETELLLLAGFQDARNDDDPYGYTSLASSFALAVLSCTPAGLWEPSGVAPYSQYTGNESVSGYHVVETTTGPLYMVGLRNHELAAGSHYDTLHVFGSPDAPDDFDFPTTPLSPALEWKSAAGYLGSEHSGYSGYVIGTDVLPSTRLLPIVSDPDDAPHPEYYLDYELASVDDGERMLVSFELVTSEEYADPYSEELQQYLEALESEYEEVGYGAVGYGVVGYGNSADEYGVIMSLSTAPYLDADEYDPIGLSADPYADENDAGGVYAGGIYTAGRGSISGLAAEGSADEGSGGITEAMSAASSNHALLDALMVDEDSAIITDVFDDTYLNSSADTFGGLQSGFGYASGLGIQSQTTTYGIVHEFMVRSVVRVGPDVFHTANSAPGRGWVLLARGTPPRGCGGNGQPVCAQLHPHEQALLSGSELEATWFAGHFETWRLAEAAAADWQLAAEDYLIVGNSSNLRQYNDDGTLVDASSIHPRLRTRVVIVTRP